MSLCNSDVGWPFMFAMVGSYILSVTEAKIDHFTVAVTAERLEHRRLYRLEVLS